jgi:RNA polymerase sigma-70 factor (ECF subfamily)
MRASELLERLEELHPASWGWALACCGGEREEADEVLQAVYLKVLEGRARFDGRSALRTWLFGVVRRTAAERRRRRWVGLLAGGRWLLSQRAVSAPSPEEALGQTEATRELRRALAELPRRQREVLHLVFYQELTVEEAGRVLGISAGSARTHYHRGKAALRARLGSGGR